MQGTISEFATKFKADRTQTAGFLNFLVSQNLAKKEGEKKVGKGKPSALYEIPDNLVIDTEQLAAAAAAQAVQDEQQAAAEPPYVGEPLPVSQLPVSQYDPISDGLPAQESQETVTQESQPVVQAV